MPWLSTVVAICLVILMSLGTWQYQRLQWKTALLAEVEAAVTAPPFSSLAEFQSALEAGKPVDFRRIKFIATPNAQTPIYAVYGPGKGGIYWDLFRQYSAEPAISGQPDVFGKYDRVRDTEKPDGTAVVPAQLLADQNIGYVRKVHAMGGVESKIKSKSNPTANRWFKFNQSGNWGQGDVMKSYYIDITAYGSTEGEILDPTKLPIRRPEIRNNHFDYMLTWYSFAFILLIIYIILHLRAGRLKLS